MGFRFRKSITIIPGVRLNLSKGGVSTSIGRRGATINLGKRGVRGTVGIPGTGLSYSEMLATRSPASTITSADAPAHRAPSGKRALLFIAIGVVVLFLLVLIGSNSGTPQPAATVAPAPVAQSTYLAPNRLTTMAQVNCRSRPSKRADIIASITADTPVAVISTVRGWSNIDYGSAACWVSSDYLG